MYISNSTVSNNWTDCVYWYKAPLIEEKWSFGCPEFHKFHDERYNPEYTENFE